MLALAALFPFDDRSVMWGFNELGLSTTVAFVVYLGLAGLAAARFAERSLAATIVWVHAAMLMKSYPWSKYALPVVVALWLLHNLPARTTPADPERLEARPSALAVRR